MACRFNFIRAGTQQQQLKANKDQRAKKPSGCKSKPDDFRVDAVILEHNLIASFGTG